MKTKILLFCMALGMFFISTTHGLAAYTNPTGNSSSIPVEGELERPISLHFCLAPIIEQQNDMLFVFFQKNVGVTQIAIADEWGGIVFIEMVNTDMRSMLTISLMGLSSGSYVITFSSENGKFSGSFEL